VPVLRADVGRTAIQAFIKTPSVAGRNILRSTNREKSKKKLATISPMRPKQGCGSYFEVVR
jgi:hypothetical protein